MAPVAKSAVEAAFAVDPCVVYVVVESAEVERGQFEDGRVWRAQYGLLCLLSSGTRQRVRLAPQDDAGYRPGVYGIVWSALGIDDRGRLRTVRSQDVVLHRLTDDVGAFKAAFNAASGW